MNRQHRTQIVYLIMLAISIMGLGCGADYGDNILDSQYQNNLEILTDTQTPSVPVETPTDPIDTALATVGQTQYQAQCTVCHGDEGQGVGGFPRLIDCTDCGDQDALAERIVTTMPPAPSFGSCDADCSNAIAYYMIRGYTTTDDSDTTATPSSQPTAVITQAQDEVAFTPADMVFRSSASTDDTGITLREWTINEVFATDEATLSVRLTLPKDYTINLTVTDEDGQADQASTTVTIIDLNDVQVDTCDTPLVYFAKTLWDPFFEDCLTCHTSQGIAKDTRLILTPQADDAAYYLSESLNIVQNMLNNTTTRTLLLNKPQGLDGHVGGQRLGFDTSSPYYTSLLDLEDRIEGLPESCNQ